MYPDAPWFDASLMHEFVTAIIYVNYVEEGKMVWL